MAWHLFDMSCSRNALEILHLRFEVDLGRNVPAGLVCRCQGIFVADEVVPWQLDDASPLAVPNGVASCRETAEAW
jgi:hypothetical protein